MFVIRFQSNRFNMGGRGLRAFEAHFVGNGQNRNKGQSPHNCSNQCHNYSVNKRRRPETDLLLFFFCFLDVVKAHTFFD